MCIVVTSRSRTDLAAGVFTGPALRALRPIRPDFKANKDKNYNAGVDEDERVPQPKRNLV
jgi:hypothetical protein